MTTTRIVRLILAFAIAIVFLWGILRRVDLQQVENAFIDANLCWIGAAIIALSIAYICRISRWHSMLSQTNAELRWRDCAGPLLAGFAANNVLPFRAGDVLRSLAFNDRLQATPGAVLATVIVERLLDFLVMLGFLGIGLARFQLDATGLAGASGIVLLTVAGVVLVVLLYPDLIAPLALAFGKYITRWLPRSGAKVFAEVGNAVVTVGQLGSRRQLLRLMMWSVLVWAAEGCTFLATALSLSSLRSTQGVWLALPVATLATVLPSTPGNIGTFDYFAIRAMTATGNDIDDATAFAFLVHAVLWLPATLAGGAYLMFRVPRKAKP